MGSTPHNKSNARTNKKEEQGDTRILRCHQNTSGRYTIPSRKSRTLYYTTNTPTHPQAKYIRNYICRTKQRKNIITDKMRGQYIITRMLQKWHMLKLEHDARQLQQEADKRSMIPIWRYQRSLRGSKKQDRKYVLNKTDGTKTKHH